MNVCRIRVRVVNALTSLTDIDVFATLDSLGLIVRFELDHV